jgi:Na+-driven multidrug efflux pump
MGWGLVLGSLLGGAQLLVLPFLSVFSPLPAVQQAARMPSIIASFLQIINGAVFIGEGVMQGCGDFLTLAASNVAAALAMLVALKHFTNLYGLNGERTRALRRKRVHTRRVLSARAIRRDQDSDPPRARAQ